ncbi:jg6960 [Pararge aegeria aegeria]|uniref:Jg6960 protein n=1 Tax=Pararge aegeria aegeria TaxID=348720 RepID=A0A8S4SNV3_9NEOP|nr:jg6960 [Pararge aegeria aegeria]
MDIRKWVECERTDDRNVRATYLLSFPSILVTCYRSRNVTRKIGAEQRASSCNGSTTRTEIALHFARGGAHCASETAAPAHSPRASLSRPTVLENLQHLTGGEIAIVSQLAVRHLS